MSLDSTGACSGSAGKPRLHRHKCAERAIAALTRHMEEMRQAWTVLGEIIGDLTTSIRRLSDKYHAERRSEFDRRRALE